jgi:hypothetical protein
MPESTAHWLRMRGLDGVGPAHRPCGVTAHAHVMNSDGSIRVVIADNHAVVRRGLRQVLEADGGFDVVAEAADVESTRRYVRRHRGSPSGRSTS